LIRVWRGLKVQSQISVISLSVQFGFCTVMVVRLHALFCNQVFVAFPLSWSTQVPRIVRDRCGRQAAPSNMRTEPRRSVAEAEAESKRPAAAAKKTMDGTSDGKCLGSAKLASEFPVPAPSLGRKIRLIQRGKGRCQGMPWEDDDVKRDKDKDKEGNLDSNNKEPEMKKEITGPQVKLPSLFSCLKLALLWQSRGLFQ